MAGDRGGHRGEGLFCFPEPAGEIRPFRQGGAMVALQRAERLRAGAEFVAGGGQHGFEVARAGAHAFHQRLVGKQFRVALLGKRAGAGKLVRQAVVARGQRGMVKGQRGVALLERRALTGEAGRLDLMAETGQWVRASEVKFTWQRGLAELLGRIEAGFQDMGDVMSAELGTDARATTVALRHAFRSLREKLAAEASARRDALVSVADDSPDERAA